MSHSTAIHDQLLVLLKSAHLQRLARFALIDGVPTPWGKRSEGGPLAGKSNEDV
jgi:hypothetical protein